MSSFYEIVLWGAPAVLLSWGLLLAMGCAMVFRDDPLDKLGAGCCPRGGRGEPR